jgi:hypothetical protein
MDAKQNRSVIGLGFWQGIGVLSPSSPMKATKKPIIVTTGNVKIPLNRRASGARPPFTAVWRELRLRACVSPWSFTVLAATMDERLYVIHLLGMPLFRALNNADSQF